MDSIKPEDLYYYSDMDIYEFTAANRSLFERLGAKSWTECLEMGEKVQPTLPEKPRPYNRRNEVEYQQQMPPEPTRSEKQWVEVQGEALKALYALREQSGRSMSQIVADLILKHRQD